MAGTPFTCIARRLLAWGVAIVPPVDKGEGPRSSFCGPGRCRSALRLSRLMSETGAIANLVGAFRSA
jgi:hypothetical protein